MMWLRVIVMRFLLTRRDMERGLSQLRIKCQRDDQDCSSSLRSRITVSRPDQFQKLTAVGPGDDREDDRRYHGMDEVLVHDENIGDGGTNHDTKAQQCTD